MNLNNEMALELVSLLRPKKLLKLFPGDTKITRQQTLSFIWNGQYASTKPER